MLNLCKGCRVPFPKKLSPGYEQADNRLIANVHAQDIIPVMERFIACHEEPLFFILELPSNLKDETPTAPGVMDHFHIDVYYLDGCTQEKARELLCLVGELLVHDGLSAFGFGGHTSGDEIMKEKYNVIKVLSRDISGCETVFSDGGIPKVKKLRTAWDTFTPRHPGDACRYELDGQNVYDIPALLKPWGLYWAEQREV